MSIPEVRAAAPSKPEHEILRKDKKILDYFAEKIRTVGFQVTAESLSWNLTHFQSRCRLCKKDALFFMERNEAAPGYEHPCPVDQFVWEVRLFLMCFSCKRIDNQFLRSYPGPDGHTDSEPRIHDLGKDAEQ